MKHFITTPDLEFTEKERRQADNWTDGWYPKETALHKKLSVDYHNFMHDWTSKFRGTPHYTHVFNAGYYLAMQELGLIPDATEATQQEISTAWEEFKRDTANKQNKQ